MPQPALHLILAATALERWSNDAERVPFPVDDASCRNAFLHGSLAPDMGLFPGAAAPAVSWHVHRGGAAAIGRRLVASSDAVLRAFGWGWVGHVIADARIHPLVNAGAAVLLAEEGPLITAAEHRLVAHIRVELGIEGWCAGRSPLRVPSLSHVFDRASIEPFAKLLRGTYGRAFPTASLYAAHRGVTMFAQPCLQLARILASDLEAGTSAHAEQPDFLRLPGVRRALSALMRVTSPAYAFLNPVRPAAWLLECVTAELDGFVDALDVQIAGGLAALPDYDLNTGSPRPAGRVADGLEHVA
jgi:hypothetical protein